MPTLSRAKPEVRAIVDRVMTEYHAPLAAAEVTVGLLMASPGENEDYGVKLHGYPCAAVIKLTPYRQRVQGIEDAVITFDAESWGESDEAGRLALVDHELTHLELALDGEGNVKSDDAGRPKLRLRLHDVQAGWFMSVAARHGEASFEAKQARTIQEEHGQLLFSWAESAPPFRAAVDVSGGEDGLIESAETSSGTTSVTLTGGDLAKLSGALGRTRGKGGKP